MRVSSNCRVWSSSDRTTIFASSACGRTSQPSLGATVACHDAIAQLRILRLEKCWRRGRTLRTMPLQKPVPLSNQSLFLSSYTLTRLRSLAGGATNAIVPAKVSSHSGQGQHALQSVARNRDALRSGLRQLAAGADASLVGVPTRAGG